MKQSDLACLFVAPTAVCCVFPAILLGCFALYAVFGGEYRFVLPALSGLVAFVVVPMGSSYILGCWAVNHIHGKPPNGAAMGVLVTLGTAVFSTACYLVIDRLGWLRASALADGQSPVVSDTPAAAEAFGNGLALILLISWIGFEIAAGITIAHGQAAKEK